MTAETRRARYLRIRDQLAELTAATAEPTAHRATAAALLHHKLPGVSWTGFYILRAHELVVDAYQGPLACLVLEPHRGVCWAALDQDTTLVVPDVHAFPGHIACDDRARSEVVVPVHGPGGAPIGVLDVDSHRPDQFDDVDKAGYELVVALLEERWRETEERVSESAASCAARKA